jgi:NAD(P)-dependent dehydrogenase (short-subunit alcohol dehydrogenase family)
MAAPAVPARNAAGSDARGRRDGDAFIQATPLKRLGNEHDLKGICVLFASDASSFITGQVIAVDGGLSV